MKICDLLWLNGKLCPQDNSQVSLMSHALHYGSAIFDGLRFYATKRGPAIFHLDAHIDRFFYSAKAINLSLPYSKEEIKAAVIQVVNENKCAEGYIRLIGFFGEGDMELHPTQAAIDVAIICWPWAPRMGTQSIRVKTSTFVRTPPQSTVIAAKLSGHYANSILARQEAKREGFHEALLLDYKGNIAEASGANFFAVKDNVLLTPPAENIFPGITREMILQIADDFKIPCIIDNINPLQISCVEEAFFCGTAMEIISIESIDHISLRHPQGPVTNRIKTIFSNATHGEESRYLNWLTFTSCYT